MKEESWEYKKVSFFNVLIKIFKLILHFIVYFTLLFEIIIMKLDFIRFFLWARNDDAVKCFEYFYVFPE